MTQRKISIKVKLRSARGRFLCFAFGVRKRGKCQYRSFWWREPFLAFCNKRRKAELLLYCGKKLNSAPPCVLFLLLLRAFVSCNTALGRAGALRAKHTWAVGTQGFRVMNPQPPPPLCSNVRTLCSRQPPPPPPSKFEGSVHSYGAKAINSHPAPVWNWRSGWTDVHFSPLGPKISQMQDK